MNLSILSDTRLPVYAGRRHRRRLKAWDCARKAVAKAQELGRCALSVEHGGRAKDRRTKTDACVVLGTPDGRAFAWLAEIRADTATLADAAEACIGERLFDVHCLPCLRLAVVRNAIGRLAGELGVLDPQTHAYAEAAYAKLVSRYEREAPRLAC